MMTHYGAVGAMSHSTHTKHGWNQAFCYDMIDRVKDYDVTFYQT